MLELVGAAKQTALFEEAFGMTLVRTLRSAMEDHPIVVAAKRPLADERHDSPWAARIDVLEAAPRVEAAGRYTARVRRDECRRTTVEPVPAPAARATSGWVCSCSTKAGRLVSRDHHRVTLPRRVLPRRDHRTRDRLPGSGSNAGARQVKFDLVAEGVTWFEPTGSSAVVPVQVV